MYLELTTNSWNCTVIMTQYLGMIGFCAYNAFLILYFYEDQIGPTAGRDWTTARKQKKTNTAGAIGLLRANVATAAAETMRRRIGLCVSASYGEKNRQCHLHTHATIAFPSCGVTPYKRFLKTETNCVGASEFATDYVRSNLIREHGKDPCFPDPSFLHPELAPVCPIRKLDGSEGPRS
ncbi:hypothetical protein PRIPAC_96731 [Pristionchus pacificus]|uniref:Uncharacterized protein n=1 Tax=Pristionchus pacificus TaxID=54126 RepID=A0A2A6B2T5_PRIPA|nr:hypothetical protein PRIPAC_96731 [Pristionchus pacificus]|eukprot:PDM60182.1 hypothetical protein PRIPAC_54007 [Pristionchus pacificus]